MPTFILTFILGLLPCCMATCGPARAATTEQILRTLCKDRGVVILPLVETEAHAHKIRRSQWLALLIAAESRCDETRVSRKGALGLGQILPTGNAALGHTRAELLDPAINIYLTARHFGRLLCFCKGNPRHALSIYSNNAKVCKDTAWSHHVMNLYDEAARRRKNPRRCN